MRLSRSRLAARTFPRLICQSCARSIARRARTYASLAHGAHEIFDVVCVGGGPAGLSFVTALRASQRTSKLKVALIDSQDLSRIRQWKLPSDQFSNRVSSLTPSSVGFLEEIGAWQHIMRPRIQPYHGMQVWDSLSDARISFDRGYPNPRRKHSPLGESIAYMCENLNLTSSLLRRLEELQGLSIFDNTQVDKISLGTKTNSLDLRSWPVVRLSSGQEIAARLLVGADGANSSIREFAGIETRGWDYNRHGVVATIKLEDNARIYDDNKTAYQRFLPTGPVALLPLPSPYATLVWSTLPSHAAHLKNLSTEDFIAMVNAAFRLSPTDLRYMHTLPSGQVSELLWRSQHNKTASHPLIPLLAASVQEGTIASFPLKYRHADTYTGSRVALVGDAAHSIHPLAGQGLNQGQGDIQALVRTIEHAVDHGADIGDPLALESYGAERYAENNTIMGVVDKLHKLYAVESAPVVAARSVGLSAVNALGGLKEWLMDRTSGAAK